MVSAPAALSFTACGTPMPELANADVSVYMLMKLLGHESMATSQRYVAGAGTENRDARHETPLSVPDEYQFTDEQRGLDR